MHKEYELKIIRFEDEIYINYKYHTPSGMINDLFFKISDLDEAELIQKFTEKLFEKHSFAFEDIDSEIQRRK